MKKPLPFLPVLIVLFVALAGSACSGAATQVTTVPAEGQPTEAPAVEPTEVSEPAPTEVPAQKVLRVAMVGDNYLHDPELPARESIGMAPVNTNVFENLVWMDSEYQLHPMLAESWEYDPDREVWTFQLREGVTFHDGSPFTAEDVVYSFGIRAQDYIGGQIGLDESSVIEAVDDYTVEVHTSYAQTPQQITHPFWGIRRAGSDPFAGEYIGTGPFMFEEYVKDDFITVVKNPDYWGDPAGVDMINFRFMPDPTTRILALQAGEVDLIVDVPHESVPELETLDSIQLYEAGESAYLALTSIATGEAPFDLMTDAKVREALGYALNREVIIDAVYDGQAINTQTYLPATILQEFASLIEGYTYDPDKARALLEEAGWVDTDGDGIREKDGRTLSPVIMDGFPSKDSVGKTGEVIQAQLLEVGVDASLLAIPDTATFYQLLAEKQADLYIEIGNQNSASPCFMPRILYYADEEPNSIQAAASPFFVGFPEIIDEIDACTASNDPKEAQRWTAEAMHTIIDEARTVNPIANIYRIWASGSDVGGFSPPAVMVVTQWHTITLP